MDKKETYPLLFFLLSVNMIFIAAILTEILAFPTLKSQFRQYIYLFSNEPVKWRPQILVEHSTSNIKVVGMIPKERMGG